jgi:hypothetical protein
MRLCKLMASSNERRFIFSTYFSISKIERKIERISEIFLQKFKKFGGKRQSDIN